MIENILSVSYSYYTQQVRIHVLLLASNKLIRNYGPQPVAAIEITDFLLDQINGNMHQSFLPPAILTSIRMNSVGICSSAAILHRVRFSHIYIFCDLQPVYVQLCKHFSIIISSKHCKNSLGSPHISANRYFPCPVYLRHKCPSERPAAEYLSVRPLPGISGSSYSVDASVQVYDDVDGRDEDLGGDEDDD